MVSLLLSASAWADSADLELGEEIYGDYCQGCHGADKSGLDGYSDSLEDFTQRIEGVTENMPDFAGFFEPEEIAALYAYLMADE